MGHFSGMVQGFSIVFHVHNLTFFIVLQSRMFHNKLKYICIFFVLFYQLSETCIVSYYYLCWVLPSNVFWMHVALFYLFTYLTIGLVCFFFIIMQVCFAPSKCFYYRYILLLSLLLLLKIHQLIKQPRIMETLLINYKYQVKRFFILYK